MATIKEIAEMLGVSTATVSNVIHGKTKKVSEYNIRRIEKALKETHYSGRMEKNALQSSKPLMIGVVVHTSRKYENTFLSDPFYSHLIGVLEEKIRNAGYYMMLYASEDIEEIYRMVVIWNIAGLIAITFTHIEYNKLRALVQRPVVAIDLYDCTDTDFYNVGTQDRQGGYSMTKYLLECGYSNILVIGNRDVGVDYARWQGYEEALKEGGSRSKIYPLITLGKIDEKRIRQFYDLLGFIKKNKETALFFLADSLAVEGMNYFIKKGIQVPEEVGIAGYDDNLYSGIAYQGLTTVSQNITIKAEEAVRMLLKLLNHEKVNHTNILLPVSLVIRSSTVKKG